MIEKPAKTFISWFESWPALVRGLAIVIAVTAVGIVPPTILDEVGVRLTPRVPWVAPVALAWMWMVWCFLRRPGWRWEHLQVRPLPARQWAIAVSALAAGTWAIHTARMAGLQWPGMADVRVPDLRPYSISVLWSSFLVTALAAGLFEEAAYRGYLQKVLEERYGWRRAIALSALVFALAHLSRGHEFVVLFPLVFGFGCLYGVVAWKTGSIEIAR